MLQAALSECLLLDLLSHFQDFRAPAVINVGGCQVGQALVVAVVVVVLDKGADLSFKVVGQVITKALRIRYIDAIADCQFLVSPFTEFTSGQAADVKAQLMRMYPIIRNGIAAHQTVGAF